MGLSSRPVFQSTSVPYGMGNTRAVSNVTTIDITYPCRKQDLNKRFCGRRFGYIYDYGVCSVEWPLLDQNRKRLGLASGSAMMSSTGDSRTTFSRVSCDSARLFSDDMPHPTIPSRINTVVGTHILLRELGSLIREAPMHSTVMKAASATASAGPEASTGPEPLTETRTMAPINAKAHPNDAHATARCFARLSVSVVSLAAMKALTIRAQIPMNAKVVPPSPLW